MKKYQGIHWLPQEDYDKAIGQLRVQVAGVFEPFHTYGHDAFIPGDIGTIVKLAEDFALRVRGVDKPISLELIEQKRGRAR